MQWVRERLILVRNGRLRALDLVGPRSGVEVVQISADVYLDISDIPESAKPWDLRRLITMARVFGEQERLGRDMPMVITGEAALVLSGLASWWNVPDIQYRSPVARRKKRKLPAVTVSGVTVPPAFAVHVTGGIRTSREECATIGGVALAPAAVVISDLALTAHPLQVFVGASSLLATEVKFNRYKPSSSRHRESVVKSRLAAQLKGVGKRRGSRLAINTVWAADAGVESPAEAALLWGLHCLLPKSGRESLVTQYPVEDRGKRYFLDVAVPKLKAAIEPDGALKFDTEPQIYAAQKNDYVRRNHALTAAGWRVGHIPAVDLADEQILVSIHSVAADVGMFPKQSEPVGKGVLWRPFTTQLFSLQRRF